MMRIQILLTLRVTAVFVLLHTVYSQATSDNAIDEELHKPKNEFFKQDNDDFFKEFEESRERHQRIFAIVAGTIVAFTVLVCICIGCCFLVPACCIAKEMAKRRNRRNYTATTVPIPASTRPNQPGAYPGQASGPGDGYPLQPTANVTPYGPAGYPYGPTAQPLLGPTPYPAYPAGQPVGFAPNTYPPQQATNPSYPADNPPPYLKY